MVTTGDYMRLRALTRKLKVSPATTLFPFCYRNGQERLEIYLALDVPKAGTTYCYFSTNPIERWAMLSRAGEGREKQQRPRQKDHRIYGEVCLKFYNSQRFCAGKHTDVSAVGAFFWRSMGYVFVSPART